MTVSQSDNGNHESRKKHWGPERRIVINRQPGHNLGLSIVGGNVDVYNGVAGKYENISGIFIKHIIPDSPADQTKKLKPGDRIIEVDGIKLGNSTHERAVELIQVAGDPVHLLVQSLEYFGAEDANSIPSRRKSRTADHRMLSDSRSTSIPDKTKFSGTSVEESPLQHVRGPPELPRERSIVRDGNSLKRNGTKRMSKNLAVISESQQNFAENERSLPTQASQSAANTKSLHQDDEDGEKNRQNTSAVPKSKYSSDESSEDEDTRHLEGNVYTKAGKEISRRSAGNVKRSAEEIKADPEEEDEFGYTTRKIQKKYKNLGDAVLLVQLKKDRRGLGISLSGHKDRSKMAVFICGINPSGTAFKTGGFVVSDEVLEVNGHVLLNRCHLNASSIIKGIPGPVFKFVVFRKPSNVDKLAVKPITQFSSALDEDDAKQFSQYKGVHAVSVKKGQYGLGIMIIEGKHAEVGQGIFVSDIQEGSAAEQAGLQVGDLILSVNFDCLLGATHDEATALLKKTEGVVTLTVCNPNQKKVAQEGEKKAKQLEANKEDGGDSAKAEEEKAVPVKEPEKPKEPEAPQDPKDCKILLGRDTTIEFKREANEPIGFSIIGGSDTLLIGVFILDVYPDGSAGKDGRLKPGDQIIDFCHQSFKSILHHKAHTAVLKASGSINMIVLRDEKPLEEIEVELQQKSGKGIGLCISGFRSIPGAYISEVVAGSSASENDKIIRGDRIVEVSGENVSESTFEDIAVLIKGLNPVTLKLTRYKSTRT